jgi:hypothetical protein
MLSFLKNYVIIILTEASNVGLHESSVHRHVLSFLKNYVIFILTEGSNVGLLESSVHRYILSFLKNCVIITQVLEHHPLEADIRGLVK